MLVPDSIAAALSCPQAARTRRTSSTGARRLRRLQNMTLGVLVATALSSGGLPHTATIEVEPASVNATITVADSTRAEGQLVLGRPRVAATTTGTVTASLLYMRAGPGTNYEITGKMPYGTKLDILAQQPGWYKVRTPMGYVGWASSQYIALTNTPPPPPSAINLSKYPTTYTANNGYVYTGRRAQVLHHIKERFGTRGTTYAGHSDCPTCSADLWTPDARGGVDNTGLQSMNNVAWYLRVNASALGIKHIIWNQRLSIGGGAWQAMEDRGSITANHKDHVHITFVDSFR